MENIQAAPEAKKRSKAPLLVTICLAAVLAGGYLGLCALAASAAGAFYPNASINGVEVGGLTVPQAAERLAEWLPGERISLYLSEDGAAPQEGAEPAAAVAYQELGITAEAVDAQQVARCYDAGRADSFLLDGWNYAASLLRLQGRSYLELRPDEAAFSARTEALAEQLSRPAEDTRYEMDRDTLAITNSRDGMALRAGDVRAALEDALAARPAAPAVRVRCTRLPARTLTAREIYEQVSGEVKNAGYDRETERITPEQVGADFDAARAQQLMDAAGPGETVEVAAEVEFPAVTAEALEPLLFRDVLGTYTTHVGGSAARISNVKLAAAAINGTVLNGGDVFDYNQVVGQRTADRGYQAAPAYVKGETVDEIGGGVCQPSSTLYLACLKSNLEIVERYAHRYVPAYIPKGMDATVSWGGPNYRFRNDTDYPVRVEAVYAKGYLTMTLVGTRTDGITVKMTNKVLSTTPAQVVYQDDPTLPAGTEQVKTTPYTGYKVETYRNLYDGEGRLLSSTFEAGSDYKVRNKVILKGPAAPEAPTTPTTPTAPETPVVPGTPIITPEAPEGTAPETDGGAASTAPEGGEAAPEETAPEEERPPAGDGGTPAEAGGTMRP